MLPTTLYAKNPDTGEYVELTQFYDQNRSPVVFDEIAPVMYDAILSSEDKNFYKHGGIDLVGTVSAVYDNVRGHDTRGGSSISQQYVKNILVQRCEANATEVTEEKDGADGRRHDPRRGPREVLHRRDDVHGHGGPAAQAPGDALRDRPRAEVLEERDPARLSQHRGLRRHRPTAWTPPPATTSTSRRRTSRSARPRLWPAWCRTRTPTASTTQDGSTTDSNGDPVNSAADGYKLTKDRQVYVLDRLLADGKITQEQHDTAVAEPITPAITQPQDRLCIRAVGGVLLPVRQEHHQDRPRLRRDARRPDRRPCSGVGSRSTRRWTTACRTARRTSCPRPRPPRSPA